MSRTVTITGGSLVFEWDLSVDDYQAMPSALLDVLGPPRVTHVDGTVVNLNDRMARRVIYMGEVGPNRREIEVEPVTTPEKTPAPIQTPAPEQVPVPV